MQAQIDDCFASIRETLSARHLRFQNILKQTVFLNASDNRDFYAKKNQLITSFKKFYKSGFPPTAIVGQPPEDRKFFTIELILLPDLYEGVEISRKELGNNRYTVVDYPGLKEVYASGLSAGEQSRGTLEQAKETFGQMKKILQKEDMDFSHVVRQWNYIEDITGSSFLEDGSKQNYQVFNDVRALYYEDSDFKHGYPAATGIGMNSGGVVLEFIAARVSDNMTVIPIENPRQVDAHRYSNSVLVGDAIKDIPHKASPKFERAKLVGNQNDNTYLIYISGTAAIRGEETVSGDDVEAQTRVTIENIAELISPGNLKKHGTRIDGDEINRLSNFRVYVKNEADLPKVKNICDSYFHGVPGEYLVADICRDCLLVEIEGII
ncbi:MAG: hypothetical protein GY950_21600 [bacterium]|nr:hypothetical protein [bacterium]